MPAAAPPLPPHKACPACGQRAVLTMTVCGRCGRPFAPPVVPPPVVTSQNRALGGLLSELPLRLGAGALVGGLVYAGWSYLFASTTVQTPDGQTVNNIGLLADRTNAILIGLGVAILGALLLIFLRGPRQPS